MLIMTGLTLIVVGFLIEVAKIDQILRDRLRGNPVMEKLSGNAGIIFFVAGLILVLAGVYSLYYG